MRKTYLSFFFYLFLLITLAAGGYFVWKKWFAPRETISIEPARISRIEQMVQLCSMDIYSEVPVLDTVNRKVIFAIQKQTGSIYFDVEKMTMDTVGDTVRITLPPPIVEVRESTAPHSWEVIDTKGLGIFVSDRLTIAEENTVKRKLARRAKARLYANGTVARAREEAARNLKPLVEALYGRPVVIIQ